jgi:hypothetical protein
MSLGTHDEDGPVDQEDVTLIEQMLERFRVVFLWAVISDEDDPLPIEDHGVEVKLQEHGERLIRFACCV